MVAGGEEGPLTVAGEGGGVRAAAVTFAFFLDAADCFPFCFLVSGPPAADSPNCFLA